jgi:acyl-CoA thioesterase-1
VRATLLLGRWARFVDGLRLLGWFMVLIALVCVTPACGGSSSNSKSSSSTSTSTASQTRSVVALGDSVPYGTNCDCRPYPLLTGDGLTKSTGQTVTVANDAVPGYTTSSVIRQLNSDNAVIDRVRHADVVEIEIGANDVGYGKSCGTSVDCYTQRIPTVETNLKAIVSRVHELTSGHKMLVVLLGYWSVWLGGKYAVEQGAAYTSAAAQVTHQVNDVMKSTASATGSAFVDLRKAFKGPDTGYLSSDGDHPNAKGHELIAATAEDVIEKTLHI